METVECYKPKTKGERRMAIEIGKGITDPNEISKNTGYKLSTVLQYMALYFPTEKARVSKHKGKLISETTRLIIEKLNNEEIPSVIAKEVGVSRQRVYYIKKNYFGVSEKERMKKQTATEICLKIIDGQPEAIKKKWVEWFNKEYGVEV